MRWKVGQLGAAPKKLDYYFLRSSLNPDDLDNRFNFEETTVHAPSRCKFDQNIKVELTVKEDGTAIPRFIYHTGQTEAESVFTKGHPFALDVTYGASSPGAQAYIGFDFGTSNSSVSFVESRSVTEYKRRLGDASWKELSEVAYELPYPIAIPLLAYLSESSNKAQLTKAARQAAEAMLALAFFAALLDYRLLRQRESHRDKSKVFGQLSQRSTGPLWGMLRQLYVERDFRKKATFTASLGELFDGETYRVLDSFVTQIALDKHDKADAPDLHRPLHVLANRCNLLFSKAVFGFFQNLATEKFTKRLSAAFRIANGSLPFIKSRNVKLDTLVHEFMPYLLVRDARIALPLSPMLFWWQDPKGAKMYEHGCCYIFDYAAKDGTSFSFKTVDRPGQLTVSADHPELAPLAEQLRSEQAQDTPLESIPLTLVSCGDD